VNIWLIKKGGFDMKRMILVAGTIFFAFSTWVAQATVQTKDSFTWSAELVALDEGLKTVTVKAWGWGEHVAADCGRLKAGERVVLRWSGYDISADSIVRGLRTNEVKADERFVFPVEFVSFDPERKYITFKVVVPETSLANIKMLKPGEWVTATSPHGSLSKTTPVVAIRPYVLHASTSSH
jgi:hypothetical protein